MSGSYDCLCGDPIPVYLSAMRGGYVNYVGGYVCILYEPHVN